MAFFAYFFSAVAEVLNYVLEAYKWIIIARAVLSWVNPDPYNPIVRFIYNVTEPVLGRIRRSIPVYFGGIDFSPIVVFLAIIFSEKIFNHESDASGRNAELVGKGEYAWGLRRLISSSTSFE